MLPHTERDIPTETLALLTIAVAARFVRRSARGEIDVRQTTGP